MIASPAFNVILAAKIDNDYNDVMCDIIFAILAVAVLQAAGHVGVDGALCDALSELGH